MLTFASRRERGHLPGDAMKLTEFLILLTRPLARINYRTLGARLASGLRWSSQDFRRSSELQFRRIPVGCGLTAHVYSAEGSESAPQLSVREHGADPHQHRRLHLSDNATTARV